ncbi:MAG: DNA translocase FtsK 4TM domain-containing protein [Nitriliruptoraceae bacterium]
MASSTNTPKRSTSASTRSGSGGRTPSSGARGSRSTPANAKDAKGAKGAKRSAGGKGGAGGGRRTDADRGVLRGHLGERRVEIGGLALVVLGVVAGLGTYADAAGPVGEFLEAIALGLLGLVGYVVPVVVTWFGLLVVIGRPGPEVGRIAVGAVLSLVGVLGGLHLLADAPDPSDGIRTLWRAGGLLGWAVATPLTWALSVWGAAAVLLAVLLLGSLVTTGTPFSRLLELLRAAVTPRRAPAPPETPAAAPGRARSRGAASAGDDATPTPSPGTRVRATLAGTSATQPSLAEGLVGDADDHVEVARVPDPPVDRARVPAEATVRKAAKVRPVESFADYQLPSLELLAAGRVVGRDSARVIEAQTVALQETFDQFGVDATVARSSRGPTVTRFEIELGPGVQVKKVASMGDDIAYALAAPDVRIVAPIPGKSAIGVEVPNRQRDLITLGDILRSDEASRDPHPLTVALGVDIAGTPELINLATMPHLLVSGGRDPASRSRSTG